MTVTIPVWLCWTLGILAGIFGVMVTIIILFLAYVGFTLLYAVWKW